MGRAMVFTYHNIDMVNKSFEEDFLASKAWKGSGMDWLTGQWSGMVGPNELAPNLNTGVQKSVLEHVGTIASTIPSTVKVL
jgi:hypothetical protein